MGAGILSLHQSLGIIIGANVGTTVTGQIIRLLDLDASSGSVLRLFQPSTLAPVALVAGMVLIMGFHFKNAKSIGNIAVGFGILFSGLLNMTGAVNSLAESGLVESLLTGLGNNPFIGYLTGAGIAFALQSSSATIGILQTFSASGLLTFKAIYAVIVGIYLGDCVTTAIVCSIGAKTEARRVGVVNILFNLSETVLVLRVVTVAHRLGLLDWLWDMKVNSGVIANTNTVFNLSCAVLLLPMVRVYEKLSRKILPDQPEPEDPYKEKLDALSPAFFNTPALALRSCYDLLLTVYSAARENISTSLGLISAFDEKERDAITEQEGHIDRITDRLSRYIVELLPHLKEADHIAILNQYYRDASEFERLGDQAVRISDLALQLRESEITFSETAQKEIAGDTRIFVKEALAETENLRKYRLWVPMIERQMATAQLQLNWMIKDFKRVDELMPKAMFLDPTTVAMKLARQQMLGADIAEMEKVYRKGVRRLRYNQNVLLAATWSWILVNRGKVDEAFKALTEALKSSDDATLKRNHECLMNNKVAHFSNSGIGDQWYSLFLEEPKIKAQRPRSVYR